MQHTSCKLIYTLLPGIVNQVCVVTCQVSFFNFIEILTADIIFYNKRACIGFFGSVSHESTVELENSVH